MSIILDIGHNVNHNSHVWFAKTVLFGCFFGYFLHFGHTGVQHTANSGKTNRADHDTKNGSQDKSFHRVPPLVIKNTAAMIRATTPKVGAFNAKKAYSLSFILPPALQV
jgi:hypothetical protein